MCRTHLSDLLGDVLAHVLHRNEQSVLLGSVLRRRDGAVRVALPRLLVRHRAPGHAHAVDAGHRQHVRLAAGQPDPVARRLRVARRLAQQCTGRRRSRGCRRRSRLLVVTCRYTTTPQ